MIDRERSTSGEPQGEEAATESGPVRWTFAPRTENARRAREFVTEVLERWDRPLEEVRLAVSELATNAVVHANSEFTVSLRKTTDGVLIEIEDRSSREPVQQFGTSVAIDGRGLAIVDRLARRWGVRQVPEDGKVVWAEF